MTINKSSGSGEGETLASLPPGVPARLLRPKVTTRAGHRLLEMGLTEGTEVRVVRRAPLGDPLEVHARGTRLSLREVEAQAFPVERMTAQTTSPVVERTIALVGNPNSGKTTLFNRVTGLHARTGNYPGVTVEHREGELTLGHRHVRVLDLPGTYSLVPRAEDEALAVRVLLGLVPGAPLADVVVCVVDGSHLERNLFLLTQLVELDRPVVVAVTMLDVLQDDGVELDLQLLSERCGVPVVAADELERTLTAVFDGVDAETFSFSDLPPESAEDQAMVSVADSPLDFRRAADELRYLSAIRHSQRRDLLVSSENDPLAKMLPPVLADEATPFDEKAQETLHDGVAQRYAQATAIAKGVARDKGLRFGALKSEALTTRIDSIALHPRLGLVMLVLVFGLMFQALFSWSGPMMEGVTSVVGMIGSTIVMLIPASFPLVRSLWLDGVIAGVGNVLVFIPQIFILFFALGLLEDSGYLARAAFLLDRVMARAGLHGRAFVPMLSGFACAVPAVMAARTVENEKDRLVTILVTPLVSCSARLPVFSLIIATLFSTTPKVFGIIHPGTILFFSMYALGLFAAVGMAAVFKRTLLRSPAPELVLELPPYRSPRPIALLKHSLSRVRLFVVEAGTIILALTIVLWGLFNFPRNGEEEVAAKAQIAAMESVEIEAGEGAEAAKREKAEAISKLKSSLAQSRVAHSLAGRLGYAIEPIVAPLGFDWKMGVGLVASFAAREVLVSSLGLVYGLGDGQDETSVDLREAMKKDINPRTGKKVYTPLVGLSLMVFFVLAMQCMSTLAAVRRETGGWKWPAFQFTYMTALAYAASFLVFQIGTWLGWG